MCLLGKIILVNSHGLSSNFKLSFRSVTTYVLFFHFAVVQQTVLLIQWLTQ